MIQLTMEGPIASFTLQGQKTMTLFNETIQWDEEVQGFKIIREGFFHIVIKEHKGGMRSRTEIILHYTKHITLIGKHQIAEPTLAPALSPLVYSLDIPRPVRFLLIKLPQTPIHLPVE